MNGKHLVPDSRASRFVEVKSKFGAEFRRFCLQPSSLCRFCDFYTLLQHMHHIPDVDILVGYADPCGGVLPISNDNNYHRAMSISRPLLRIFLQRKEDVDAHTFFRDAPSWKMPALVAVLRRAQCKPPVVIGAPRDFRAVSSVVDTDVLPVWLRRVRLHRRGSDLPLGFYIRDGTTNLLTSHGVQRVPGVFISRVMPGGLAHSTGLLAANDQVLEVNGVPVAGKSLDQVTDMMVANSHNLIVTVRPADQQYNMVQLPSAASQVPSDLEQNFPSEKDEESEEEDLVVEAGQQPRPVRRYKLHLGLKLSNPHTTYGSSTGSLSATDSEGGEMEVEPEDESSLERHTHRSHLNTCYSKLLCLPESKSSTFKLS